MMDEPLVSCIMPTRNRRAFVPLAITYFLRQDYLKRELVIVDDGADPIADLVPDDPSIHYLRMHRKRTLGATRNVACDAAQGELILHWDDDDWMASWRISYQVEGLCRSGADICGVNRLCYLDLRDRSAWQYTYPDGRRPYVCDSTMCYPKDFWRRNPFPDVPKGAELAFLWNDTPKHIAALEDDGFYIGLIHTTNKSPMEVRGPRWSPYPVERIQARMGDDWDCYFAS